LVGYGLLAKHGTASTEQNQNAARNCQRVLELRIALLDPKFHFGSLHFLIASGFVI
jgi:hypothetical protein